MIYLDKIILALEWLSNKFGHLCVCLVIAMFFTYLYGIIIGSIAGITVGVFKELFDKWRGSKFDLWDLSADLIGVIVGVWIIVKFV